MAEGGRKKVNTLIMMGLFVLVLTILLSWSFHRSNTVAGSFRLGDIQICEELDEELKPVSVSRNMPVDSQQVCLWFNYSRARNGDTLEISWYLDEKIIQKETVRLSDRTGTRAFYLLKEDGSPLDVGFYSVFINCNGREQGVENFTVTDTSDDVPVGNVIIWD